VALEQRQLGGTLGALGVEVGLLLGGELAELALLGLVQREDLGVERLDLAPQGVDVHVRSLSSMSARARAAGDGTGLPGVPSGGSSAVAAARPSPDAPSASLGSDGVPTRARATSARTWGSESSVGELA
jgi:hypothetical protein